MTVLDEQQRPAAGDAKPRRRFRFWIPVMILLLYAGIASGLRVTESMLRGSLTPVAAVCAVLMLWLWWTFGSGLKSRGRWVSLGLGGLVVAGVVFTLKFLVRYEGSANGSAFPKLVWRWSPTLDERLLRIQEVSLPPGDQSSLLEDGRPPGVFFDSPEYDGPLRNGTIPEIHLVTDWKSDPPQKLWRKPIGLGWSSFAVVGKRAITQEQRGKMEWVSCYDLLTGRLLWVHEDETRFSEPMGGDGPRATPTVAGKKVFTMGGTGIVNCLSLTNGAPLWSRRILAPGGGDNLSWGKAASPLFLAPENAVVVTGGRQGGPTVIALNAGSGKTLWTSGRDAASYSSPIAATVLGVRQIISANENTITGLDPATGELLWSHDWPKGLMPSTAKAGQPQLVGERNLLLTASYGVGSLLIQLNLRGENGWSTSLVWHNKTRMKTKFSSACVKDGYAYGLDEGVLACQDLATGRRVWKEGRYGYGQNLLVGDLLLIQAESGDVVLVQANPDRFKEMAAFPALAGKTWNVPTLAGQYLLVRNDREAACYRLPVQPRRP